ncbi:unnamed protein product [Dimorphilus gyrociliatus]|uniref:Uncharacterized protein n=1 Tax=Dimorphilus gyrociliatus TaxID=2664684 RepID=A0A7I8W9J5_9ANNE|nr:unnamed protein product [Dimorphilus gyrociliatus]
MKSFSCGYLLIIMLSIITWAESHPLDTLHVLNRELESAKLRLENTMKDIEKRDSNDKDYGWGGGRWGKRSAEKVYRYERDVDHVQPAIDD